MAYQRGVRRGGLALIQQGLKPTGGSIKEEGFYSVGHIIFYQSASRKTKTYHGDAEARRKPKPYH